MASSHRTNRQHESPEKSTRVPIQELVEQARGTVAALSYVAPTIAREIHVNSIQRAFARSGNGGGYRVGLTALQLIGEVQQLPNGYWFPTPVRVVPLGSESLVLSPSPTMRLAHELPSVRLAGLARICPSSDIGELPLQQLDDWMRSDVHDTASWGTEQLERFQSQLRPTVDRQGLEYFRVTIRQVGRRSQRNFVWEKIPSEPAISKKNIYLCREQIGFKSYSYYLIERSRTQVSKEASIVQRPTRLMYAIAALQGKPIRVLVDKARRKITLSESLPAAEHRFFRAVANRVGHGNGSSIFEAALGTQDIVLKRLGYLGCELENVNG